MKHSNFTLPAFAALALAACQQPADDANAIIDNQANAADFAAVQAEVPPKGEAARAPVAGGSGEVLNEADDAGSEDPNLPYIPAQYRGRWGMVAADCTSTRGDAKGLIYFGDTTIKFYESLATLVEQRPAIATSFSGLFRFTGEGQTWQKVMTFTRVGNRLTRADEDGRFTYTRCA